MLSNKYLLALLSKPGILFFAALLCAALTNSAQAQTPGTHPGQDNIQTLLNSGHADEAIAVLGKRISAHPQDAAAHNFLCRVEYQEERWPDAMQECETAVQLQPSNSEFHDWLGRADGQQAQRVSKFSAFGLARKVHAEFQTAVQLDPRNVDALLDLGEFAIEAPSFLGGGMDKAESIAKQLQPLNAAAYHGMLAQIAGKKKDLSTVERELKLSVAQAKAPAHEWMNLAGFYAQRKNFPAMDQAIQSGMTADPGHGDAWVHGASVLIRSKQNFPLAEQMLRAYLTSANPSEAAPAFQVHVQLGRLLAQQGNKTGAQQEYAAAQALASGYAAARHAE